MKLLTKNIEVTVERDGAKIKGRKLTPLDITTIQEQNLKLEGKGDGLRTTTDYVGVSRDTFVAMITHWESVYDQDGNELTCTEENKALVWEHNTELCSKIIEDITTAVNNYRTEKAKN